MRVGRHNLHRTSHPEAGCYIPRSPGVSVMAPPRKVKTERIPQSLSYVYDGDVNGSIISTSDTL